MVVVVVVVVMYNDHLNCYRIRYNDHVIILIVSKLNFQTSSNKKMWELYETKFVISYVIILIFLN